MFLKVVCAWCGEQIGEKPGPEGEESHGICLSCIVEHFPEPAAALGLLEDDMDQETKARVTRSELGLWAVVAALFCGLAIFMWCLQP